MKTFLLLFAMITCLAACSDEFNPKYKVIQLENGSYVVQTAWEAYDGSLSWDKYGYGPCMTKEAACKWCKQLIQKRQENIELEKGFEIKRVIKCQ